MTGDSAQLATRINQFNESTIVLRYIIRLWNNTAVTKLLHLLINANITASQCEASHYRHSSTGCSTRSMRAPRNCISRLTSARNISITASFFFGRSILPLYLLSNMKIDADWRHNIRQTLSISDTHACILTLTYNVLSFRKISWLLWYSKCAHVYLITTRNNILIPGFQRSLKILRKELHQAWAHVFDMSLLNYTDVLYTKKW